MSQNQHATHTTARTEERSRFCIASCCEFIASIDRPHPNQLRGWTQHSQAQARDGSDRQEDSSSSSSSSSSRMGKNSMLKGLDAFGKVRSAVALRAAAGCVR